MSADSNARFRLPSPDLVELVSPRGFDRLRSVLEGGGVRRGARARAGESPVRPLPSMNGWIVTNLSAVAGLRLGHAQRRLVVEQGHSHHGP
jgi:hypothetical protein